MTLQLDILHMIFSAGLMVQLVLLLLLFFSVTSWAIIFIKYQYLKKAMSQSIDFTEYFWKKRDFSEAFARTKQLRSSPVANVFRAGYMEFKRIKAPASEPASGGEACETGETARKDFDFTAVQSIERALQRSMSTELAKLHQRVPFLATTGNTTPFIGLFGTVWGIMNSFREIGERGSASLAVVAPGISEALVATAAGLAAAIPAVVAYNYFLQRIDFVEGEMNNFSAEFLNIIERQLRRAR